MNIVFRVDASTEIGSGHLMRCLTLANRLKKEKQAQIIFISRELNGNLNYLIEKNGYCLLVLPKYKINNYLIGYQRLLTVEKSFDARETKKKLINLDVDCLIVDSYALDAEWEKIQRPYVKKIMVIDDLANRCHDCDILLDQNYYKDMSTRYNGLVPDHCKLLLGPKHALLRHEFYEERKHLRVRDGNVQRILIFFGGSDLTNETMKALYAIVAIGRTDMQVDVVVGGSNKHKEEVEQFVQQHKYMKYHCQVGNMAELMHKADLSIGAGGSATWERCFLGLPTIVITIAENQVEIIQNCVQKGLVIYLGCHFKVTKELLLSSIKDFFAKKTISKKMSKNMIKFSLDWNETMLEV